MYTMTEEKMMALSTERSRLFREVNETPRTSPRHRELLDALTANQDEHNALCEVRMVELKRTRSRGR